MRHSVFQDIINQIHNNKVKTFVVEVLKSAPEALEEIPASSSGKHHPPEATTKGGLVWHTQLACWFGNQFIEAYQWAKDDIRGDVVLAALILHDIGKREKYKNYFDYIDHPKTATKMLTQHRHLLPEKIYKLISNCVLHHMGPFGGKFWKKDLSKYNLLEITVYNSDYLASRKDIKII